MNTQIHCTFFITPSSRQMHSAPLLDAPNSNKQRSSQPENKHQTVCFQHRRNILIKHCAATGGFCPFSRSSLASTYHFQAHALARQVALLISSGMCTSDQQSKKVIYSLRRNFSFAADELHAPCADVACATRRTRRARRLHKTKKCCCSGHPSKYRFFVRPQRTQYISAQEDALLSRTKKSFLFSQTTCTQCIEPRRY